MTSRPREEHFGGNQDCFNEDYWARIVDSIITSFKPNNVIETEWAVGLLTTTTVHFSMALEFYTLVHNAFPVAGITYLRIDPQHYIYNGWYVEEELKKCGEWMVSRTGWKPKVEKSK